MQCIQCKDDKTYFATVISYAHNVFMKSTTGVKVIKLFTTVNQCLLLAGLSSLFYGLWVRPGAYHSVENLKEASLK